jgi:hypothetical protein
MDFDEMTLPELHEAWVNNWKVLLTGIQEIIGDGPMPDPREVARLCADIPEDTWVRMFTNPDDSKELQEKMGLTKVIAEVQLENVSILNAAIAKGAT